jgi:hypothetical protein
MAALAACLSFLEWMEWAGSMMASEFISQWCGGRMERWLNAPLRPARCAGHCRSALLGLSRRAKLVPGESVLVLGATGEFRIDVEKAPLERVEEMWQREFHGRRLVLVP